MRSAHALSHDVFRFGEWVLIPGQLLLRNGERQPLSPKELAALTLLVENAGLLVSKEDLISSVWHDEAPSDDSISRCVYHIRKAIGVGPGRATIETIPRRGFRFSDVVSRELRAADSSEPLRVAILPFAAPDAELSATIHEEFVSKASQLAPAGLIVVARDTAARFAALGWDRVSTARKLRLDFVVAGTIRRSNGTVRLRVELVRASDDAQVWSGIFDCSVSAVESICTDMVHELFAGLETLR